MSLDGRYLVETPEQIDLSYELAGIGTRFIAALLDTALLLLLQAVLIALLIGVGVAIDEEDVNNLLLALWAIASFVLFWGYYTLFEWLWGGQSPGKRLLRLRVVREGGRPATLGAITIRNLIRIIDFLPSLYGIGVLAMFIDRRSRRLGDLAAGTIVVKDRAAISLAQLSQGSDPVLVAPRSPDAPEQPLLPNLQLLSEGDYDLVQDFLRRRAQMEQLARAELANRLAAALRTRLGLAEGGAPEQFLEHLVREYRQARAAEQNI